MEPEKPAHCAFVIKVEELAALNYLAADHPRPSKVEWINRGTDQVLKSSSIEMLMRTLFQPVDTRNNHNFRAVIGLVAGIAAKGVT